MEQLKAIGAEAAAIDAELSSADQVPAELKKTETAQAGIIAGALELAVSIAGTASGKKAALAAIWTKAVIDDASEHAAKICELHGWDLTESMGTWAPYLGLAVALAQPALQTRALFAEAKKDAEKKAVDPDKKASDEQPASA